MANIATPICVLTEVGSQMLAWNNANQDTAGTEYFIMFYKFAVGDGAIDDTFLAGMRTRTILASHKQVAAVDFYSDASDLTITQEGVDNYTNKLECVNNPFEGWETASSVMNEWGFYGIKKSDFDIDPTDTTKYHLVAYAICPPNYAKLIAETATVEWFIRF